MAREIREAGVLSMEALYMGEQGALYVSHMTDRILIIGFYIHSCQKMRYKGEYSPSYLADPVRVFASAWP